MNMTDKDRQAMANAFAMMSKEKQLYYKQQLDASPNAFDIYEYLPMRMEDEVEQFKERGLSALTFGAYDAKPVPNAGDFPIPESIPYIGGMEVSPSGIAGDLAGSLPAALAGYGVGAKIASKVIPNATRAAKAAGAAKLSKLQKARGATPLPPGPTVAAAAESSAATAAAAPVVRGVGERVFTMAVGESLPGALNGYIRTEGDIDEAISTAGEWMVMGLIFEGAFTGIVKAFKKVKSGVKMNEVDRGHLSHFEGMTMDLRERAAKSMNKMGAKLGSVMDAVMKPRIGPLAKDVIAGRITRAEWDANVSSMVREAMDRGGNYTPEGLEFFMDEFDNFNSGMYDAFTNNKDMTVRQVNEQYSKFFKQYDNAWDKYNVDRQKPAGKTVDQPDPIDDDLPFGDNSEFGRYSDYHGDQRGRWSEKFTDPNTKEERVRPRIEWVDRVPDHVQGDKDYTVGGNYDRKNNVIWMAKESLKEKFESKAWRNPTKPEVKPLKDFDDLEAWESFVEFHEMEHFELGARNPDGPLNPGQWEEYINIRATKKWKQSQINRAVPFLKPEFGYEWKSGEHGDWILKGDKTPISGVVSEANSFGDLKITKSDGTVIELHDSQVDSWRKNPGPKPTGKGQASSKRTTTTGDGNPGRTEKQHKDLLDLHNQYTEVYGRPPRGYEDPAFYQRMSLDDARKKIHMMKIHIAQAHQRNTDANFNGLDKDSFAPAYRNFAEDTVKNPQYYEDTRLGWFAKLLPAYSKFGLSANKPIAIEVRRMLHQMETWGRDTAKYLDQYRAALEPLSLPTTNKVMSMMPGATDSKAMKHNLARQKIKLTQALDGHSERILTENPELTEPYKALRAMLDEIAEKNLALPKGMRIAHYFPHMFDNDAGKLMAKDIASDLGSAGNWITESADVPGERMFANVLEREGGGGFDFDLDSVMYAYIKGAVKKPGMDEFIRRSFDLMDDLPMTNSRGGEHVTRKLYNDYVRYITGQPGAGRMNAAQFWQNNELFNNWTDKLVGYLGQGDANMADWLAKARRGVINPQTGKREEYTVAAELQATKFFRKLVHDAGMYNREGELKKVSGSRRRRAAMALKVEEIRVALRDPKAKPIIISKLYGMMVVNKLGGNISHAMINLTQQLTNTMPTIGIRNTTKGIRDYFGKNTAKFDNGKTMKEVLDDMGVLADTAEAQEFFKPGIGWSHEVMDMAMTPARITERFNRGAAGLGAYRKFINEPNMTHDLAIEKARQTVIDTQFPFNKAGVSPILHTPMMRFLLMFKSYPMHQINFSATLFEKAIKDPSAENMAAVTKHMMAYMSMWGMGLTVLGGTNFGWKAKHPINDIVDIEGFDSALKTLGGPGSGLIIDVLHGQIMSAANDLAVPVAVSRTAAASEATGWDAVQKFTGF